MKINNFRVELTDNSAKQEALMHTSDVSFKIKLIRPGWISVKCFSKVNKFIFAYFDPVHIFFDDKNVYFPGWPKRYFG